MSDDAAAQPGTERGRIVRWLLPAMGSVSLLVGGLWAVELSQRDSTGDTPALNLVSASLYASMIVLYGGIALVVRRWRQPTLSAPERRFRAGCEAFLVAFTGAPCLLMVIVLRALLVGDLGR